MKILVTGGTGAVGPAAVKRLVQHGHQVKVIGRRAGTDIDPVDIEGAEYQQCDVNDFPSLREQVKGMEGIVHLAAIPYPGGAPGLLVRFPHVRRRGPAGACGLRRHVHLVAPDHSGPGRGVLSARERGS